jgi:hypothetical protein
VRHNKSLGYSSLHGPRLIHAHIRHRCLGYTRPYTGHRCLGHIVLHDPRLYTPTGAQVIQYKPTHPQAIRVTQVMYAHIAPGRTCSLGPACSLGHTRTLGPTSLHIPRPHVQPRSYKSMHPQATRITQVIHAHISLGHTHLYCQATRAQVMHMPSIDYSRPIQIAQASISFLKNCDDSHGG